MTEQTLITASWTCDCPECGLPCVLSEAEGMYRCPTCGIDF